MKLQVPKNAGYFLTSCGPVSFSGRTAPCSQLVRPITSLANGLTGDVNTEKYSLSCTTFHATRERSAPLPRGVAWFYSTGKRKCSIQLLECAWGRERQTDVKYYRQDNAFAYPMLQWKRNNAVCVVQLHVTVNYLDIESFTTMLLWQIFVANKNKTCVGLHVKHPMQHWNIKKNFRLLKAFFRRTIWLKRS